MRPLICNRLCCICNKNQKKSHVHQICCICNRVTL